MATLQEVINDGYITFTGQGSYDNDLKDTMQDIAIFRGIRGLHMKFKEDYTDEYYHIDVFDYSDSDVKVNCRGRICMYINPNQNGGTILSDGTLQSNGIDFQVMGADVNGTPRTYIDGFQFIYSHNFSTDAPNGGETLSGNASINSQMGVGSSVPNIFTYGRPFRFPIEKVTFITNVPIFDSRDKAVNYINTGDPSESINPIDIEVKGKNTYYYDYRLDTIRKSDHAITNVDGPYKATFRLIEEDDKVAFVREADNIYTLSCTNTQVAVDGVAVPFSNVKIDVVKGKGEDNNTTYEYGDIDTNIQFVEELNEATNENIGFWNTDESFNGEDSTMELTEITTATIFTRPYYVTAEEMNNISKVIFTSDVDVQTALQQGLWVYSGNPIDCVVDVCLYPIDLSVFIDRTRPSRLKFGGFVYSGQLSDVSQVDYTMIVGTNKTFEMLNQRISPIYNDFRDLSNVKYSLFLPYHGLIDLDNSIVGRTLKVQCKFDVFTSQLKYYLFLDGAFFGSYECAIGKHISVIGSDWLSKSSKNIATVERIQSTGASIVSNAISLNATGVVNSVLDSLQAYRDYEQLPTTQMSGSSTSGLNIYDPMGLYLIIEQYETIKPSNLNSTYGIATYRIAMLGSVKGYCEISDIRLQSRALNEEQDEIVTLLKQGVVI